MQTQTTAESARPSSDALTYHPAWNSLPTFIWAVALGIVLLVFKRELRQIFEMLNRRLRQGASLKFGALEIGQTYVNPGQGAVTGGSVRVARKDTDGHRHAQREQYYQPNRLLMLVHKIAPSQQAGQQYDILIYLVPHPKSDATLAGVKKVEYYFGKSWGRNVFVSEDRAHGFAISTSAYGPFVCTAEIHFSDGETVMVARYIDFEMGALGPQPEPPTR